MKIIYAIPGLGTTSVLFKNIAVPGYTLKVLDWPEFKEQASMRDYAGAFLDQIDRSEPVNLIGVSFGGMLCAELAEQLPINKLILISSCKNRSEFPAALRLLKVLPVYKLFTDRSIRSIARAKRRFLGFERSFEPEFQAMISEMRPGYFERCIRYIIDWDRRSNSQPIVHIHGTGDRLLLHRRIHGAHLIKGGTHSMVLARAAEINIILNHEFNGSVAA